jgi:hypothetical protein
MKQKMQSKIVQLLFILIFLLIPCSVVAMDNCLVGDMTKNLTEAEKALLKFVGADWMKEALVCDLGNYKIAVPAKNPDSSIFIWTKTHRVLSIQNGLEINVYQPVPGPMNKLPLANLQDWNHDGIYDGLSYDVIDKEGNIKVSVVDRNLDGEPETKLVTVDKDNTNVYVWIEGGWHLAKKGGVIINGKWRKIKTVNGKWVFDE